MGFFSSIGLALSSIGSFVASVASTVLKIATTPDIVRAISAVVQVIGIALDILRPDQSPEKHGEKVLAAAEMGITPDAFATFDEYSQAIKNFEVKPGLEGKWSKEQKIAASAGVIAQGLTEYKSFSMDSAISLLMLVAQKPEFFTAERVLNLMGKTNDFTLIRDYLDDELDLYDSERVEAWLASAEADMSDGLSREEIVASLRAQRADAE